MADRSVQTVNKNCVKFLELMPLIKVTVVYIRKHIFAVIRYSILEFVVAALITSVQMTVKLRHKLNNLVTRRVNN